jgi:hypothetical protein
MKFFVSCVTKEPKFLPITQCQCGDHLVSNSVLIASAHAKPKSHDGGGRYCMDTAKSHCVHTLYFKILHVIYDTTRGFYSILQHIIRHVIPEFHLQ